VPSSSEAEQSVLGSMLIDAQCIPLVIERLRPTDFYYQQNRAIFETFLQMFLAGDTIDPVTVLDKLRENGQFDDAGGRNYIIQLMDITPTAAHVEEYIRILRDKTLLRETAEAAGKILESVYAGEGSAKDIVENAERLLYDIREGREIKGLYHIKSVIFDVYTQLDELAKNAGKLPGVPTGIGELDTFISGLNRSELILMASRPGMGKTSIALNIGLHAAKTTGKSIVIFQLEMSREQLGLRLMSGEALIDSRKLRTGTLNDDEWARLAHASEVLGKTSIYIDDNPSLTVADMKSKCRRLGGDLGLIIIDYLQLMQSGKRVENRTTEVGDISRALKIMAKELNVPVFCCAQLSRAAEQRSDKRPMLSDLRESGAIEQDADVVMFLYRDDYYNHETAEPNTAECIVAKNRHGSTGTIKLHWMGQYTTFTSQDSVHAGN
jgi:replicative DNA helicase